MKCVKRRISLPPGDILIHTGDFSSTGEEDEVQDFHDWLTEQRYEKIIVIAGNHDLTFEVFVVNFVAEQHLDARN